MPRCRPMPTCYRASEARRRTPVAIEQNLSPLQAVGGNATRAGAGRWFFNAIGAVFAYTYAHLAGLGVEIMAASQVATATCTRLTR